MDDILISVIVPAYNIESYIGRCLESILNQSYRNIEILVIDDGSTDGTWRVIGKYASMDQRIVPIHKENGGVSSARLMGIQHAHGDYIGFVDGDDYVEPEMYEHLLDNALKYNADISHCGYQMVFPDGHIEYYYNTEKKEIFDSMQGLKALIEGKFVEPGLWNKLYRRDIVMGFENSLLWDSSIKINEDLLMNYILFSKTSKSIYEDIPYYHYILREGSAATTHSLRYKVTDPIRVMKTILIDAEKSPELNCIAVERYLRVLIATTQQKYWRDDAKEAQTKIKSCMKRYIKVQGLSKKTIMMAIGVAYLEPIYRIIRKIYDCFTGIDKKYDLETKNE